MLQTLGYLAAAVIAVLLIVRHSPSGATAVTLCIILIALVATIATLHHGTNDLIAVLQAVTTLLRS